MAAKRSNNRNGAMSIAKYWSMRTGLALLNQEADTAFEDVAITMGELNYNVRKTSLVSPLVGECLQRNETADCYAVQFMRSFSIGLMDIEVGDWVLAAEEDMVPQKAAASEAEKAKAGTATAAASDWPRSRS